MSITAIRNTGTTYENTHRSIPISLNSTFEESASLVHHFIYQMKERKEPFSIINACRNDLMLFCEFLAEKQLALDKYSVLSQELWLDFLRENGRLSQTSIKKAQIGIRSFFNFLVTEQVISQSPFVKPEVSKQPAHVLLSVPHDKFLNLCKTLKAKAMTGDAKSIRDWTLIIILGECGLKATEISNLTLGDVRPEEKESTFEKFPNFAGYLRVLSNKYERFVPYSTEVAKALELLKEVRTNLKLSTTPSSRLFFGYLNMSRRTRTDFLHRHGIKFVVYDVCSEILGVPYNSESLRNHAIFSWIDRGYKIEKIAALAGYSTLYSMERFLNSPAYINSSKRKNGRI